jgi:hypothetical protein
VGYARGTYYYQLFSIPVTTAGLYTFQATTTFPNGSEGILYQAPGPVPDAGQTIGASVTNALLAVGSPRPDFVLTKTLAMGQYYLAVSTYNELKTGSFTLTVTAPTPLPVRLLGFTAQAQAGGVQLRWTTASEEWNAFFQVERSADGWQWQTLGQVAGVGTSGQRQDYTWLDAATPSGRSYYRLQQTDTNGMVAYSPVVSLLSEATPVSFFPNPVRQQATFTSPGPTTLTVRDALGRPCQVLHLHQGRQQLTLDELPAGVYLLTNDTTQQTLRLLKATP